MPIQNSLNILRICRYYDFEWGVELVPAAGEPGFGVICVEKILLCGEDTGDPVCRITGFRRPVKGIGEPDFFRSFQLFFELGKGAVQRFRHFGESGGNERNFIVAACQSGNFADTQGAVVNFQ